MANNRLKSTIAERIIYSLFLSYRKYIRANAVLITGIEIRTIKPMYMKLRPLRSVKPFSIKGKEAVEELTTETLENNSFSV